MQLPDRSTIRDIFLFGLTGAAAGLANVALVALTLEVLTVTPWIAAALGFLAGSLVAYVGQSRFVFGAARRRGQKARFFLLSSAGLALQVGGVHAASALLGAGWLLGWVLAAIALPAMNFTAARFWVFA